MRLKRAIALMVFPFSSMALLATAVSCSGEGPSRGKGVSQCPSTSAPTYFFTEGMLVPQRHDTDLSEREVTSRYLTAAQELSWTCGETPLEGYRVLMGGGFGAATAVVSAKRTSSGWHSSITRFAPLSETQPPYRVIDRKLNTLSEFPVIQIRRALESAAFWTGPVWKQIEGEGHMLSIEVLIDGDHRVVSRAVPDTAFREAASLIVKAAGAD